MRILLEIARQLKKDRHLFEYEFVTTTMKTQELVMDEVSHSLTTRQHEFDLTIQALQDRYLAAQQTIARQTKLKIDLQEQITAIRNDLEQRESELAELRQISQSEDDLNRFGDDGLHEQYKQLLDEHKEIENTIAEITKDNEKLKDENDALQSREIQLQAQIDVIGERLNLASEEKRIVQVHLTQAEQDVDELKQKEQELLLELENVTRLKQSAEEKLDAVVLEKRTLEKRLRDMTTDFEQMKTKYEKLSQQTVNQSEAICRVVELERQVSEFDLSKRGLENHITTLSDLLLAEQDHVKSLELRVATSKKDRERRYAVNRRDSQMEELSQSKTQFATQLEETTKKMLQKDQLIDILKERLKEFGVLQKDREALSKKLSTFEHLVREKENEIQSMRDQDTKRLSEEKRELEIELELALMQLDEKDKVLEELKKTKREQDVLTQEREGLDDEYHIYKQAIDDIDTNTNKLKEKTELLQQIKELEEQIISMKQTMKQSTSDTMTALLIEKQDLERRLEDALKNEDSVRREKVDLAKQLVNLKHEMQIAQEERNLFRDRANNAEAHSPRGTMNMDLIETLKAELERKFETESKQLEQVRIELLEEKEKTKSLTSTLLEWDQYEEPQNVENNGILEQQLTDLMQHLEQKEKEEQKMQAKIHIQEKEINNLKQLVSKSGDSDALKVHKLEEELREIEADKLLLIESVEISNAQSAYLKEQLDQREQELSEMRGTTDDQDKKLRNELQLLKQEKEKWKQEMKSLESEMASVEKLNQVLGKEVSQAKELLEQSNAAHELEIQDMEKKMATNFENQLGMYDEELIQKTKQNEELTTRVTQLETQVETFERKVVSMERDIAMRKRKILDLEKELAGIDANRDMNLKENVDLILDLKKQVQQGQTKIEQLLADIDDLNKEIRKKSMICTSMEKEVKEKDKHVKEVSKLLNFKLTRSKEEYEKKIHELELRLVAQNVNVPDGLSVEEENPKLLQYIQQLLQVVDKTRRERDHFKSLCDTLDTSCNVLKKHIQQKDEVIAVLESQISETQEEQYSNAGKMEAELHSLSNYLNRSKQNILEMKTSPKASPSKSPLKDQTNGVPK